MTDEMAIAVDKSVYLPGESIRGKAGWISSTVPRKESIRLFWRIVGDSLEEVRIVEVKDIPMPQAVQDKAFEFQLPGAPYSFSGVLFRIEWGVELILERRSSVAMFAMFAGEPKNNEDIDADGGKGHAYAKDIG